MRKQKGMLSFETVILLSFLALLMLTGLAIYRQYTVSNADEQFAKTPVGVYGHILSVVRNDIMFAIKIEAIENGLSLHLPDDLRVAYQIVAGSLWRFEGDKKKTILMHNIEKYSFKIHSKNKMLFSIYLYPKNKMFIPFFTSFALRGQSEGGGI